MEAGVQIGDYKMMRRLGAGGMAQVWLARHPRMNRQVAIKFVLDEYVSHPEIKARFHAEAWRQSGLQHPNIVPIETVLSLDRRDYIVMKFVDSALDRRIASLAGRPLPLAEALDIALQLLDALHYTHTLPAPDGPLIHRDVKPSNILLTRDGTVQLTDFGIALATGGVRHTLTGHALGTAFYMSPEQIMTPAKIDARTDIYSAGCVLYEMLAAHPPFGKDGDTDFSIQREHCERMPAPLRKSNPGIPERFEWIILKSLAKDADFRFRNCREFASALLTAYREEGLPLSQLHGYHGGLTPPPPDKAAKHRPTVVEPAATTRPQSSAARNSYLARPPLVTPAKPQSTRDDDDEAEEMFNSSRDDDDDFASHDSTHAEDAELFSAPSTPVAPYVIPNDSKPGPGTRREEAFAHADTVPLGVLKSNRYVIPDSRTYGIDSPSAVSFIRVVVFGGLGSVIAAVTWAAVQALALWNYRIHSYNDYGWGHFFLFYLGPTFWSPFVGWIVAKAINRVSPTHGILKHQSAAILCVYLYSILAVLGFVHVLAPLFFHWHHYFEIREFLGALGDFYFGFHYGMPIRTLLDVSMFCVGLFIAWRMTGPDPRTLRTLFKRD